jgi:hypothetical protein
MRSKDKDLEESATHTLRRHGREGRGGLYTVERETFINGVVDLLKRHSGYSLGPGAVRGISPQGRRKEVGEPVCPPLFQGAVQAHLPQSHA